MKSLNFFTGGKEPEPLVFLARQYRMHCSHSLANHKGKCVNLHGHTYKIELGFQGHMNPETNMLIDTGELDKVWEEVINSKHDHRHLNETMDEANPTMEFMAKYIYDQLEPFVPGLQYVDVWETQSAKARYIG